MSSLVIRKPSGLSEWAQIHEICCLTGNAGAPIETSRWPFFSEEWVGPYQRFCADWTWVATVDSNPGFIEGYLTGCSNTSRMAFLKKWIFGPVVLLKIVFGYFKANGDTKRWLRRYFGVSLGPESLFSESTRKALVTHFPAHLHMNCRESSRGKGMGAALIEAYFLQLKQNRVVGIHLFCGEKPVKFYERMGLKVLERIEFGQNKIPVYCMVASLR